MLEYRAMSSSSPLTIGFIASRKGFLKVMGSLVDLALRQGHRAVLFWNPDEPKLGESVREVDLGAWPGAVRALYRPGRSLLSLVREHRVTTVVGPSLHYLLRAFRLEAEAEEMRRAGIRLHSIDYLLETVTSDPAGYRLLDTTFYASAYQRDLHRRLMSREFAALGGVDLDARSAVCGSTMLDQLALVNRAAVRKRYGLEPDRPVVLLMSLKMAVPDPWRKRVWGKGPRWIRAGMAYATGYAALVGDILSTPSYKDLTTALRRFADRSGAALVVKSREKNRDPRFLRDDAHAFVLDETLFPYTSIELMAIADLCVHFQSGAVLEAAFAGAPSLSIKVSQRHLREYASLDELYGGHHGSLQNFDGVVWSADPGEAVTLLDRSRLADFRLDHETRRQYVEKFLGFDDTRSSERVLDVIERQLG